ncbi:TIM barrel protein [Marinilongibacter aquaticus]|uniref:hydroxypyruvate isomerase family protein n=1 Tax=Marinilongibacter aquaticus TaxID=2975157 RepID=UPI0021BDAE2A|nr:TIM barrel protein [Marinilongibacter aquaticus]UBM60512.1 TIM barrel protein [Marinilongibacter aquaticus]
MNKDRSSRRTALKTLTGTAGLSLAYGLNARLSAAEKIMPAELKGRINHSVCQWCYGSIPLEDLCKASVEIGLESIELIGVDDFDTVKKYGLTCAMVQGASREFGITNGWNKKENHKGIIERYMYMIDETAKAGFDNVICFSGNREEGLGDEEGLLNCAEGLKKIMSYAEKKKVTVVMELLNSKVDHKNYMCDHTNWGVELCKEIGSERFKLLYDIYHMQIMEGDVIRTINESNQYFAHYHTGGVPGRNEIDETQELYYPAIMEAIVKTGFKGFVAQEFIPKRPDKIGSLEQGVQICDV